MVMGALILVGLLGHLINQQQTTKQAADDAAKPPPGDPAPQPAPERPSSDAPRRNEAGTKPVPLQAVYMVTHKHRLRDCHGTLTFTRNRLRYDSDEPQDSFNVRRDDVTIEGDVLRIRNRPWRFEFNDGIRVERVFNDWKAGTLPPATAP